MKEVHVKGKTLAKAYHAALHDLDKYGEVVDCGDWNTKCVECAMTIEVENPLAEPMISKCFIGGPRELQQYVMEMLDGILDFEIEKGNWSYTYHDRMVRYQKYEEMGFHGYDQIKFVVDELKRNPDSRRAVILIRNSDDIDSDDPACLQHTQYFIRNGKLECYVMFRSNDACKASFMNMFALILLQERIAYELGVEVGKYVHRANSYHCYERDIKNLTAYVARLKTDKRACEVHYKGDWAELMEDEVEDILKDVEVLKNRSATHG